MKRILGLASAVVLCAACRSPAPMNDPFLGRTTVEPPGTALPPPGQPYYGAPPGAATTPPMMAPPPYTSPTMPRTIGPANFSPAPAGPGGLSSSFSPNVSPIAGTSSTPTLLPNGSAQPAVTPVSTKPRPTYGPPGGLAYPPAAAMTRGGSSALAQATPPKPLDVDRLIGPATPASPATARALRQSSPRSRA
jgi:hypothetical protein